MEWNLDDSSRLFSRIKQRQIRIKSIYMLILALAVGTVICYSFRFTQYESSTSLLTESLSNIEMQIHFQVNSIEWPIPISLHTRTKWSHCLSRTRLIDRASFLFCCCCAFLRVARLDLISTGCRAGLFFSLVFVCIYLSI